MTDEMAKDERGPSGEYLPCEGTIRRKCRAIQAGWTLVEERSRRNDALAPKPVETPVVRTTSKMAAALNVKSNGY